MNLVSHMMDYEMGLLSEGETLELFSDLVKTGLAWQLQGSYGRTANALIKNGYLDDDGNLSDKALARIGREID